VIPSQIFEYLGSSNSSIDQAINDYTIVVAQPVEKHTIQVSDNDLMTWYKFSILELITPLKTPPCVSCLALNPPKNLALNSNEFWVPRNGGSLIVDGVDVEQKEAGFPQFEDNQKYLMFVLWYPNKVALPAGGPIGVFSLSEQGTLTSFHSQPDIMQKGIMSKFHGSLNMLRRESKSK
jgi:hypothetical protein